LSNEDKLRYSPPLLCYGVAAFTFSLRSKAKAGGGGEIRTHEAFRPSGFQDRRDQPLCHPSGKLSFDFAIVGAIGNQLALNKFVGQTPACRLLGWQAKRPAYNGNCFSTARYVHVNLSHAGQKQFPADR
jgi:hypothetical protein